MQIKKPFSQFLVLFTILAFVACSSDKKESAAESQTAEAAVTADMPAHGQGNAYVQVATQNADNENIFIFSSLFTADAASMDDHKKAFRTAVSADGRFEAGVKFGVSHGPFESAAEGAAAWAKEWTRLADRDDVAAVYYVAWTPEDKPEQPTSGSQSMMEQIGATAQDSTDGAKE